MSACKDIDILLLAESAIRAVIVDGRPDALHDFESVLRGLSPLHLARLDERLRSVHRSARQGVRRQTWRGAISCVQVPVDTQVGRALRLHPAACLLFAHSFDGHEREAAIRNLPRVADDAAAVTVLLLRCNDWVPDVRDAARKKLKETVPSIEKRTMSQLVVFAVGRMSVWQRGGAKALQVLETSPVWEAALLDALMTQTDGPLAKLLRRLLRTPDVDPHLPNLAVSAKSVLVRAVAAETVLAGRARWRIGFEQQWINKPLGRSRRRAVFAERPIDVPADVKQRVIHAAARDRTATVRKIVSDALIITGPEAHPEEVALLTKDTAKSVRDRMEFFHRKWVRAET